MPLYMQYYFFPWSFVLGLATEFILVNPLTFALNIDIKDPFFVICNDNFEKLVISLLWKKTCCYGYAIFFILLTKSMKKPNTQLVLFAYFFFMLLQIVDWNVPQSVTNSRVFLRGFNIPSILLKHLDRGLMSVLVWVHLSTLRNQFETLR